MSTPKSAAHLGRSTQSQHWIAVLCLALLFILVGCGGGSDETAIDDNAQGGVPADECSPGVTEDPDCATLVVGLTDAEGDFVSYAVDVQSINLERRDGLVVETIPNSTRIDFAQYTDLTEFFTAAQIPPGSYVSGSITLDYSNAEIMVEASGEPVAATVVDAETGEPLTIATLQVQLDGQRRLVVNRGIPSLLTLDFDLAASHMVDTSVSPAIAEAEPFLIAEIDPVDSKDIRVRGALRLVDLDNSSYTVAVRPYHRRNGDFGRATVFTDEETTYEVDGVSLEGQAGLEALADLETGTVVIAAGVFDVASRQFTADTVVAGDSVPGLDNDAIIGNVIGRDGNSLQVRGAVVVPRVGEAFFNTDVTVEIGENTGLSKQGDPNAELDLNSISVGQRIIAIGDISASVDGGPRTLDATEGRVRMVITRLNGTLNSVLTGQANIDLQSIDRRRVGLFDFAGTGVSEDQDANPEDYEIATQNLDLSDNQAGAPVRVFGFVTPFGTAPVDFEGRTVVDFSDARSALDINWDGGTAAPFLSIGEDGIVLDLENESIGRAHYIRQGSVFLDLFELPASPTLVAAEDRPTVFAIKQGDTISTHNDFANFVADLSSRLDGATTITRLHAAGRYSQDSNIFAAKRISANLD